MFSNSNKKLYYVYIDWTTDETKKVFYVGKGNKSRVNRIKRNKKHTHIVNKHGISREVVLETFDEKEALSYEIELIKKYNTFSQDYKNFSDFKANRTIGGEGSSGLKLEDETISLLKYMRRKKYHNSKEGIAVRTKISNTVKELWKDPIYREKCVKAAKNRKPITEETREKIRENSKKQWQDPEHRKKVAETKALKAIFSKLEPKKRIYKTRVKEDNLSEEELLNGIDNKHIPYINKFIENKKSIKEVNCHSKESNMARSETMKNKWKDPVIREKMLMKRLKTNKSPEYLEKR